MTQDELAAFLADALRGCSEIDYFFGEYGACAADLAENITEAGFVLMPIREDAGR